MTDFQLLVDFLISVGMFTVVIYIIVQVMNRNTNKKGGDDSVGKGTSTDTDAEPDKKIKPEKTEPQAKSILYISDDFRSDSTGIEKENNHTLKKIYIYKEVNNIWVCPWCETENYISNINCCLCQYKK